jgi:hypothetical protein
MGMTDPVVGGDPVRQGRDTGASNLKISPDTGTLSAG